MITVSEDTKVAEFHDALARAFEAMTNSEASGRDSNKKKAGKDRPYSTLTDVDRACRAALTAEGFTYPQFPSTRWTEDHRCFVAVKTTLCRKGVTMEQDDPCELPVLGQMMSGGAGYRQPDAQAVGSGITYGRRYSLTSMLGLCPEDDDGHAASGGESKPDPRWDAFQSAVRRLAAMRKVEHDAAYAMVRVEAKIQPGKDGPTDPQLVVLTEVAERMAKPQPSPMDRLNAEVMKLANVRGIEIAEGYRMVESEANIQPAVSGPTAPEVVTLLGAVGRLLADAEPTETPGRDGWIDACRELLAMRRADYKTAEGLDPSDDVVKEWRAEIQTESGVDHRKATESEFAEATAKVNAEIARVKAP